nr:BPK_HP1_G0042970.mRNA.1.CDS.1 [Saccharomyces cerevisiae]
MLRSNFDDSLLLIEKCKKLLRPSWMFPVLLKIVRKCSIEFSEKPSNYRLYHVSRQFPYHNRDTIDGNNLDLTVRELYRNR